MPAPTDHERAVLDFDGLLYSRAGAKEQAIHDRFAMSATRYYLRLRLLLEWSEALVYAPMTVLRLQRIAEGRRQPRRSVA